MQINNPPNMISLTEVETLELRRVDFQVDPTSSLWPMRDAVHLFQKIIVARAKNEAIDLTGVPFRDREKR